MGVGQHEIYWHRLLAALPDAGGGQPALVEGAPLGYLTAYRATHPDLAHPVELWPRLLARPAHRAAIELPHARTPPPKAPGAAIVDYRRAVNNARKLLEAWQLLGGAPLPESFARALVRLREEETLAAWLERLATAAGDGKGGAAR